MPAGQHDALQVDAHYAVPLILLQISHCVASDGVDRRIVEQNAWSAVAFQGGVHHGPAVVGPGNVGLEHRRFAAFFLDDGQSLFRAAGYHVNQQHFGALAGE